MTDPERLSDSIGASDVERELLLAAQSQRLPDAERRAVWAGIALSLPATPPAVAPSPTPIGPAAARSAFAGYLAKGVLLLGALGGLGVGAATLLTPPESVRPLRPSWARTLPRPAAAVPAASAAAAPLAVPSHEPEVRGAPLSPASQLREESLAVLGARAALRAGDVRRSLALLEQARRRFPRGALGQEREALTIQALARAGQHALAQQRATAFLRAHPSSPYGSDLERIASP